VSTVIFFVFALCDDCRLK